MRAFPPHSKPTNAAGGSPSPSGKARVSCPKTARLVSPHADPANCAGGRVSGQAGNRSVLSVLLCAILFYASSARLCSAREARPVASVAPAHNYPQASRPSIGSHQRADDALPRTHLASQPTNQPRTLGSIDRAQILSTATTRKTRISISRFLHSYHIFFSLFFFFFGWCVRTRSTCDALHAVSSPGEAVLYVQPPAAAYARAGGHAFNVMSNSCNNSGT